MRKIAVKYAGDCRKCGTEIPVGALAVYERRVGIFCPACAPTESEEIRAYRQEGADRKADRLDGWAEKRESRAAAQLDSHPTIRHDWAFCTQPGHIPFRARMIAADDRAFESLDKAREMRERAAGLRHVRVAGDAARADAAADERVRGWLRIGMIVTDGICGEVKIMKINKKTASVITAAREAGAFGGKSFTTPLHFLRQIREVIP